MIVHLQVKFLTDQALTNEVAGLKAANGTGPGSDNGEIEQLKAELSKARQAEKEARDLKEKIEELEAERDELQQELEGCANQARLLAKSVASGYRGEMAGSFVKSVTRLIALF